MATFYLEGKLVKYEDHNGNLIEGVIHLGEYFYKTEVEETRHYGYFIQNQNVIMNNGSKLSYKKLHFSNGVLPDKWKNVSEVRAIVSVLDYDLIDTD